MRHSTASLDHYGGEDWIKSVDRGDLWHVRETTFQVFFALEEGVRQYLAQLACCKTGPEIYANLIMDEDIQFYWSIATAAFDVDDVEVHENLLKMIIN